MDRRSSNVNLSPFKETLADLKWTDVQRLVQQNALVLLPLGVIEEHGPQLCLGTDIYTAHLHCLAVKEKLEQAGRTATIAPPFYWGICQSTGSFIGSFRIQKETARALLLDILTSLAEFGFRRIYGVNAHGDIEHQVAILEACKEAGEKLSIQASLLFPQHLIPLYGLKGDEPYICSLPPSDLQVSQSSYPDVHAGDIETATMQQYYPHLTDADIAKSLPPVTLGDDKIWSWLLGGQTRDLSPDGYLGSPADYESVAVIGNIEDIARRASEAILTHLQKTENSAN
jgi:creatinine amidohydrolase